MRLVLSSFISLLVSTSVVAQDDYKDYLQTRNTPNWVYKLFISKNLKDRYELSFKLNPFYLRGDLNGDSKPDITILVTERNSGKKGILICHYGTGETFILGAGNKFGNGGDDFSWLDIWQIYPYQLVREHIDKVEGRDLARDAIYGKRVNRQAL